MEEEYLFYLVAIILLIVLAKLKTKPWWKLVNLVAFSIYFSIAIYNIIIFKTGIGDWVVYLTTSLLMLIHIAFLVIVYFIVKEVRT